MSQDPENPMNTHHLFWPKSNYKTKLEREFRELWTVELPVFLHQELHELQEAPLKPSEEFMREAVRRHRAERHDRQARHSHG